MRNEDILTEILELLAVDPEKAKIVAESEDSDDPWLKAIAACSGEDVWVSIYNNIRCQFDNFEDARQCFVDLSESYNNVVYNEWYEKVNNLPNGDSDPVVVLREMSDVNRDFLDNFAGAGKSWSVCRVDSELIKDGWERQRVKCLEREITKNQVRMTDRYYSAPETQRILATIGTELRAAVYDGRSLNEVRQFIREQGLEFRLPGE